MKKTILMYVMVFLCSFISILVSCGELKEELVCKDLDSAMVKSGENYTLCDGSIRKGSYRGANIVGITVKECSRDGEIGCVTTNNFPAYDKIASDLEKTLESDVNENNGTTQLNLDRFKEGINKIVKACKQELENTSNNNIYIFFKIQNDNSIWVSKDGNGSSNYEVCSLSDGEDVFNACKSELNSIQEIDSRCKFN